jgi:hypothetical protein
MNTAHKIPSLNAAELSMAHMSDTDSELLEQMSTAGSGVFNQVRTHENGHLVFFEYGRATESAWIHAIREAGFSETFVKVFRACKRAKFTCISFEGGADDVEWLPIVER